MSIEGSQIVGGVAYIDAEFALRDASAASVFGANPRDNLSGQGGESAWVPSVAVKTQLDERFDLGLAIYSPYGLSTEYDKDWVGRYHAVETDLMTLDIQPTLNYRATSRLDLAVGLRAQYADATLSNAMDWATIGAAQDPSLAGQSGSLDGFAEVTGDDWGYGYVLGALLQVTEQTRLGVSYRSKVDLTLDGEVDFSAEPGGGETVLAGLRQANAFTDGGGSAQLTTPAAFNMGVHHQSSDRLALMANAEWTEWSSFDELVVEFDDNTPDSRTEENWSNTWAFSVGANYALTPRWLLRAGLGVDESPIPSAEYRTPRVPDADRTWATLGATWMPSPELGVTAGYMRLFGDDVDMDQQATPANENASRGNLSGDYEVSADVFALSVDYHF